MAYEETLRSVTMDADSSIAVYTGAPGTPGSTAPNWGYQFRFVKITGANQAGLAVDGVTDGVLQNKPQTLGDAATVATHGISMVQSGAALAAGVTVGVDSTGRAIASATGNNVGKTVTSTAGANQLVAVLLKLN